MRLFKYFTLSVLSMVLMASCNSDGSNTQSFSAGMLFYATTASGEAYSTGAAQFNLDYSNPSDCSIVLSGVLIPGMGTSMSFRYDNLTMASNNAGFALASGSQAATKVVCNLDGPYMNTVMTVDDGSTDILALNRNQVFYSLTNSVASDGTSFSTSQADKNLFLVSLNETDVNTANRNLDLLIQNAQFKSGMNESVQLKNIKFGIAGGRLSFSADELPVYTASGLASTTYKVLDLSGSGRIGGDYTVSFVWRETDKDGGNVDYTVRTTLKTLLSSSSSGNN